MIASRPGRLAALLLGLTASSGTPVTAVAAAAAPQPAEGEPKLVWGQRALCQRFMTKD